MKKTLYQATSSANPVVPSNGTSKQPIFIVNTPSSTRSVQRYAARHPSQIISLGGGPLFPHIKCSKDNLLAGVLAIAGAAALVYGAKFGYEWCKEHFITRKKDADKVLFQIRQRLKLWWRV